MAKQNIFIGRIWPVWPTYAHHDRTAPEMEQFQTAWQKVMSGAVTASVARFRAGRTGQAQTESGWDRDPRLRLAAAELRST